MARTIPIISLNRNLIVAVQTELSDRLVAELKDDLCCEIQRRDARGLIIEVSGVDIFDTFIAHSIREIAHVVRLMGVETVLAGLDPSMAITLVEMGMTMEGVDTAMNLEGALALLQARREARAWGGEGMGLLAHAERDGKGGKGGQDSEGDSRDNRDSQDNGDSDEAILGAAVRAFTGFGRGEGRGRGEEDPILALMKGAL